MEMLSIARAMSAPDSGLEIKDRTWLKITFPNSFLGNDILLDDKSVANKSNQFFVVY